MVTEMMRNDGNQSFKNGDYYDALWKYEHAIQLLDSSLEHSNADEEKAILHSCISTSCMELGDKDCIDLLHSVEGLPIHQIMWYGYSHQHAHSAIALAPYAKIAYKVQWRIIAAAIAYNYLILLYIR